MNIYDKAYSKRLPSIKYTDYGERVLTLIKGRCNTLLDVGCGRSVVTAKAGEFCKVVGLDISEEALKPMRKLMLKDTVFVRGDCLDMPFERGVFDCVTACELIEHLSVKEGLKFLDQVKYVLEPKGIFVITTPIKKSPLKEIYNRVLFEIFDRGIWSHIHEYSITELFETLIAQFEIIHFEKTTNRQIFVVRS